MKKISKGALAMVLAGAVTFSVANALLAEQPLKRLAKEIALPISADREKADVIKQAEKNIPSPTTNVKDHDNAVTQVSLKNSNLAAAAVQSNTKKLSYKTTTNETPAATPVATTVSVKSAKAPTTTTTPTKPRTTTTSTVTKPRTNTTSTSTKPATATKPVTSTKPATTTKPVVSTKPTTPTTTSTNSSSKAADAATTKTNHGQQVSQAAKERAASRKAPKEK